MLDLKEWLGELCGRAERCLGRKYIAHAINVPTAVPYEEYRNCGNFTCNVRLLKGHAASFSDSLVCTQAGGTVKDDGANLKAKHR
jgi:hypothetical protein